MLPWIRRQPVHAIPILVACLASFGCQDDGFFQEEAGTAGDSGGDGDGDGGNNCPDGGANSGPSRIPDLAEPVTTELEDLNSLVSVVSGDFDADGADDLVLAKIGGARFFASNGDGTLAEAVELEIDPVVTFLGGARVDDLDADGIDDLVVGIQGADPMGPAPLAVFWGGDTFPADVTTVAGQALSVRADTVGVGDFDGDGSLDITGSSPAGSYVTYGDGSRGFTQAAMLPSVPAGLVLGVDAADIDADGRAEIMATSFLFEYFVVDIASDRDQSTRSFAGWGAIGSRATWRDLNGDNAADIAIGGATHVYVAWNDGDGDFNISRAGEYCTTEETTFAGGSPAFGVADYDRDGELDIAVADGQGNDLRFLFGQSGTRDFTNYSIYPVADFDPAAVAPGDYDGDGIVDVGVLHVGGGGKGLFATHAGI